MNKTGREDIVNQLIALGEDEDELQYWLDIYEYLSPEIQTALIENLSQEIEALKKEEKKVAVK